MAKSFKRSTKFDATPEKALSVLTNPEFQVERETAQDNCVGAEYKEISRSDTRLVYEVINTEYAKGVTGIDKNKTERVTYTYTWDLARKSCTWVYRSDHGDRVKVSGSLKIVTGPANTSVLDDDFTVEVKIPLVGGKIEGIIMKEVEAGWPKYEKVLRAWLSK
jgi:hypothetical protein